MPDYVFNDPTLVSSAQRQNAGDITDLNLPEYMTGFYEKFQPNLTFRNTAFTTENFEGVNAKKRDMIGDGDSEIIEIGEERVGMNSVPRDDQYMYLDPKEIIADDRIHNWTEEVTHSPDILGTLGRKHGEALAKVVDKRCCVTLAKGAAMTNAAGDIPDGFPNGYTYELSDATLATAIPQTVVGSEVIQEAIRAIGLEWDNKYIPEDQRMIFLSPREYQVLGLDKSLTSFDYQVGVNDFLTKKIYMVEGFMVIKAPYNAYQSDAWGTSYALPNYAYDMSKVVAVACQGQAGIVGFAGGKEYRVMGPEVSQTSDTTYIGTKVWMGTTVWQPERCASILLPDAE